MEIPCFHAVCTKSFTLAKNLPAFRKLQFKNQGNMSHQMIRSRPLQAAQNGMLVVDSVDSEKVKAAMETELGG